jgi:gluconokinase
MVARVTQIILVMGVSGSGKTTFGTALAKQLNWVFADADDYHPASNVQKMASGEALTDADREPWLQRLHTLIEQHLLEQRPLVLACSALKASYRQTLTANLEGVKVVFLNGSRELIAQRMKTREHFMPAILLESQLNTLEPPGDALVLDVGLPIEVLVRDVMTQLQLDLASR